MSDPSQLWTECVQWLIRCQILDQSHRVTTKHAEIVDFAQTLRDGVLLCQLANRLCKGSIDLREVNWRPQLSQFLCLKNICVFLEACQRHFGLKPNDLFEANDLYKVSDFGKVLQTLSKLSKTTTATQNGITGFPAVNRNSIPEHEYYNQEIYKTLAETAEGRELEEEVYDQVTANEDAKIYDHIVTKGTLPQQQQAFQPKDKRGHCIKELLDTEKNYVEALNMLQQKFANPMKEVLNPDDHKIIFMNLEDILQIHTAFQSDLCHAAKVSLDPASSPASTSNLRIGDVFVRWKSKFVCYSMYCSKLPQATGRIDQLCSENSSIRQKVLECQIEANGNKFRLQDVLSLPVQRVLKYHLLLKELVKHTPEGHDDRLSADMGLEAMLDLSLYINEVKRDCETRQIIRDIQGSIIDLTMPANTELCDYGRLLRDGELKVACHSDNDRKGKNRYVFIFDKVLLICKPLRASQYNYKNSLLLDDFRVDDVEANNNNRAPQTLLGRGWTYGWNLIKTNDETVYNFYTKSKENKEKWLLALKTANENVNPPLSSTGGHMFQFHTFDEATSCAQCNKLLRGLFYQGYKCSRTFPNGKRCDTAVHKECIMYADPCGNVTRTMSTRGRKVVAIKEFCGKAGGPQYLSFKENDIIEVITDRTNVPKWWRGRIIEGQSVGQEGYFPRENVREDITARRDSNAARRDSNAARRDSRLNESRPMSVQSVQSLQENQVVYKNLFDLRNFKWYVGSMTREEASEYLSGLPPGTFLVRFSGNTRTFAISISCHGDPDVKHIRVESNSNNNQFYLDQNRFFDSVVQLVNYFEENSLKESFEALDTTLKFPLRTLIVGFAKAMHNFQATAPNMISLETNQLIMILSKKDSERGWWKGKVNKRVGYFPLAYVLEVDDIFANLPADGQFC